MLPLFLSRNGLSFHSGGLTEPLSTAVYTLNHQSGEQHRRRQQSCFRLATST